MEGSVAIVTGGAQGIGKAITVALLENKAKVLVVDLRVPVDTKNYLESNYGPENVAFTKCDITRMSEFEAAFKIAISKFGKIDILINNAGYMSEKLSDWDKMVEVNVRGTVNGTKLALNYMGKHKGNTGGTVINVGSVACVNSWAEVPVYTGTKAFVERYSRTLGVSIKPHASALQRRNNVTLNMTLNMKDVSIKQTISMCYKSSKHYPSTGVRILCIHPGATNTPMAQNSPFDDETPYLLEDLNEFLSRNVEKMQSAQDVAMGVMHVLYNGDSGSSWLLEASEPPRRVNFKSPDVAPSEKSELSRLRANL